MARRSMQLVRRRARARKRLLSTIAREGSASSLPDLGVRAGEEIQPLDGLEERLFAVDQQLEVLRGRIGSKAPRGFRHLEARFANFGHGGENRARAGYGVAGAGCSIAPRHRNFVRDRLRPVVRITRHTANASIGVGRTCAHASYFDGDSTVRLAGTVPTASRFERAARPQSAYPQGRAGRAASGRAASRPGRVRPGRAPRRASRGASPRSVFGSSASRRLASPLPARAPATR